ncbi:hypothetical protein R3I94_008109 [Phoxinus phoxinus]
MKSFLKLEDECKKRWKNLRDRFIKERKAMREKKSGAGAEQKTTWRYFSIMSFLEPHVKERATSSNMTQSLEERFTCSQVTASPLAPQSSPPGTSPPGTPPPGDLTETLTLYLTGVSPSTLSTPAVMAVESSETLSDPPDVSWGPPSTSAPHASHVPAAPSTPRATPAPQGSTRNKKRKGQNDEFENQLMNVLNQSADEEELFLLSLAPHLRNLSLEKRSEVKIEFLTTLHRADFS